MCMHVYLYYTCICIRVRVCTYACHSFPSVPLEASRVRSLVWVDEVSLLLRAAVRLGRGRVEQILSVRLSRQTCFSSSLFLFLGSWTLLSSSLLIRLFLLSLYTHGTTGTQFCLRVVVGDGEDHGDVQTRGCGSPKRGRLSCGRSARMLQPLRRG